MKMISGVGPVTRRVVLFVWAGIATAQLLVGNPQGATAEGFPAYSGPGHSAIRAEATGFFYVKEIDNTWWFVNPEGFGFYAVGISHVLFAGEHCERLGFSPYQAAVQAKYGTREAWAEATLERFREWGFNALGEMNDDTILAHRYPAHTLLISPGFHFAANDGLPTPDSVKWFRFPNVFSPGWLKLCDEQAREYCAPRKDDPWLLGYFVDNELTWKGANGVSWGLFEEAWRKPAGDPAKRAWIDFLKTQFATVDEFAILWGASQRTWEELEASQDFLPPMMPRAYEVCTAWSKLVAERYFGGIVGAIRRHDPNHLVLGVRFTTDMPEILDVAGKYCDVISVNFYSRPEPGQPISQREIDLLTSWHEQSGRPLLISEWSFPAFDSGLPCTIGAGMRVETQAQRAACWAAFQETLFRLPFMVGSNYFMWGDQPSFGLAASLPENTNYGLLSVDDEPYALLIEQAKRLNPQVYELHAAGQPPLGAAPRKSASWLHDFPEAREAGAGELGFVAGPLKAAWAPDESGWALSLVNERLGDLQPVLFQFRSGYRWSPPSAHKVLQWQENERVMAVDLELSNLATAEARGDGAYRAVWRTLFPKENADWIGLQCLSVENVGDAPWRLYQIWCCLVSDLGGDGAADAAFALSQRWTPFYRNGTFVWDGVKQLGVGASFLNADDFTYSFYPTDNGRVKGDIKWEVGATLAPGERFETQMPPMFVFPLEHHSPAHFARRVERLYRQVGE